MFKSLLVVACLMQVMWSQALGATSETLNVTAGNLSTLLGTETNSITDLVLTGDINGTDIGDLRNMTNLSVLDLANVNIVAGGSFAVDGNTKFVAGNQIPNSMFYKLVNLTSVTLPSSVTAIGDSAFYACTGLTSATIPNSVTSIGQFSFYHCTGLTYFVIGNSVGSIGRTAFCGSLKLKEFIVSESNANFSSVEGVLFNKNKDKLIHYPNDKAPVYTIPEGVTSIEWHAFCGGTGLTSVTIPAGVTVIGQEAFCDCLGLTEIHCKGLNVPTIFSASFYNANQTNCKVYVPQGTLDAYTGAAFWSDFTNIIEELPSDVSESVVNNASVYTEQNAIVIKDAGLGETIYVYTTMGSILRTVKAADREIRIAVPSNQMYLVKISGQVFKVALSNK